MIETTHLLQRFRFETAEDAAKNGEDAHFCLVDQDGGLLAAVFDGHGGALVAEYAKEQFPALFKSAREQHATIKGAFKAAIGQIHADVAEKKGLNSQGSTATILYIKDEKAYTATLGDSEAHIYRGKEDIKISRNLDWSDDSEAARLEKHMGYTAGKVKNWVKTHPTFGPKYVRSQGIMANSGSNVSRTIGDVGEGDVISHIPKIGEFVVKKDDTIVISSDGLTDFTKAKDIGPKIEEIKERMRASAKKLDDLTKAYNESSGFFETIGSFFRLKWHQFTRLFEKNIAQSLVASVENRHDDITAVVIEVLR